MKRDVLWLDDSPAENLEESPIPAEDSNALDHEEHEEDEVTLPDSEIERLTGDIIEALKQVRDPEIPVDIYELGLIYKVSLLSNSKVNVVMTLTAPGCPVAGEMPGWIHDAVMGVSGIEKVEVDLVFDPPWTPDRMSDVAKLELGWL